jgi:hypothetical protein
VFRSSYGLWHCRRVTICELCVFSLGNVHCYFRMLTICFSTIVGIQRWQCSILFKKLFEGCSDWLNTEQMLLRLAKIFKSYFLKVRISYSVAMHQRSYAPNMKSELTWNHSHCHCRVLSHSKRIFSAWYSIHRSNFVFILLIIKANQHHLWRIFIKYPPNKYLTLVASVEWPSSSVSISSCSLKSFVENSSQSHFYTWKTV